MLASIAKDVPLRALRLVCSLFRIGVSITPKESLSSHHGTQGGPGLFKQKMIEGLDRREYGERTECEESSPRLPALSRTDSGLGAIASCFRAA